MPAGPRRSAASCWAQPLQQHLGRELQVLGPLDKGRAPRSRTRGGQLAALDPLGAVSLQVEGEIGLGNVGVGAEPGFDRILAHGIGLALVDDAEIVGKAHQAGPLADDVVGQAVQGAHPVAKVGQQACGPGSTR